MFKHRLLGAPSWFVCATGAIGLRRLIEVGGSFIKTYHWTRSDASRTPPHCSDDSRETTTTDAHGHHELFVTPEKIYLLVAANDHWASNRVTTFVARAGTPIENQDIALPKPTRLFGVLTNAYYGRPVAYRRVFVYHHRDSLNSLKGVTLDNPEGSRKWVCPMRTMNDTADEQGRDEFQSGCREL